MNKSQWLTLTAQGHSGHGPELGQLGTGPHAAPWAWAADVTGRLGTAKARASTDGVPRAPWLCSGEGPVWANIHRAEAAF